MAGIYAALATYLIGLSQSTYYISIPSLCHLVLLVLKLLIGKKNEGLYKNASKILLVWHISRRPICFDIISVI